MFPESGCLTPDPDFSHTDGGETSGRLAQSVPSPLCDADPVTGTEQPRQPSP